MTLALKTRREARVWVYRDLVARSLRNKAEKLTPAYISADCTPVGAKRVKAEMLKLAAWLEAKALRLQASRKPAKSLEGLL